MKKIMVVIFIVVLLLTACSTPQTEVPLKHVNVCYSALSTSSAGMWYAVEYGVFEKYGLDVELSYIASGSNSVAALVAGDVDLCIVAGAGVVNAVAAGQDPVMIAGLYNTFVAGFYTVPEITTPEDLKGSTIAISRPGSSSTVGTLLTLDAFGLSADTDVTLLSVGNDPDRLLAMRTGQVSGAVLSPPSSFEAERDGFNKMFDLAEAGIPYQFTGIGTTRSFIESDRETVIAFMKAVLETNALMKANPDTTKEVLARNLEIDDAYVLDASFDIFIAQNLQTVPYPTLEGLQTIIDMSIPTNPDVASVSPEQAADMSIIQELKESGFIAGLPTQ